MRYVRDAEIGIRVERERAQSHVSKTENQSRMLEFVCRTNLNGQNLSTTNVRNAGLISCRRSTIYGVRSGCPPTSRRYALKLRIFNQFANRQPVHYYLRYNVHQSIVQSYSTGLGTSLKLKN